MLYLIFLRPALLLIEVTTFVILLIVIVFLVRTKFLSNLNTPLNIAKVPRRILNLTSAWYLLTIRDTVGLFLVLLIGFSFVDNWMFEQSIFGLKFFSEIRWFWSIGILPLEIIVALSSFGTLRFMQRKGRLSRKQ
jgi:hypothetical protein